MITKELDDLKILISGSTGFIGTHLKSFLLNANFSVTVLHRGNFGESQSCDSMTYDEFYDLKYRSDFDVFIHCAGAAHRAFSDTEVKSANVTLTDKMVKKSKELGIQRFIFLSSVIIYTEQVQKITLTTPPLNLKSNVSRSKFEAEALVKNGLSGSNIQYVILRVPLVYGEGVKANFASLMKLVGIGLPLPFRSITNNKRSLVSVYNLVDLIKVCIDHPSAGNQTFLVSDDNDLSTAEIVALMAKVQGKANLSLPIPVCCFNLAGKVFGKQSVVDRLVGSLQVDIEHTKKTLNWQPPYSVEDGFKLSANRS